MNDPKVYEVLADAFAAEGVTYQFSLLGTANMFFVDALAKRHGIENIHVRHENCALAMAEGYSRSTGKVGVASVTCGPGFTQIMTALTVACQASIPMVVFAGDTPTNLSFHLHQFNQGQITVPTGARHIFVGSKQRMLSDIRDAFYIAKTDRCPVVLSVPDDLQHQYVDFMPDHIPSSEFMVTPQSALPDPKLISRAVDLLASANLPILLAGRGALDAGPGLEALAEQSGALLSTSLFGKGLFDNSPFNIGVAGGFSSKLAHEIFSESDLVVGVGAGLGHYTTEGGYLYPNAEVIHLDLNPRGISQGLRVADLHIRTDAKLGVDAMLADYCSRFPRRLGARSEDLKIKISQEIYDPKEFQISPGTIDPRIAIQELDRAIPKDWDIVIGGGHFFHFVPPYLSGRAPQRYHVINEFGAIGSALSTAMGIACARGDGKVALIDGDGALLMHVQELETMRRHSLRMLMCVINDGGYGAETHKFRGKNMDASQTTHGRGDLAKLALGFGLRGVVVKTGGNFNKLFADHQATDQAELWDIHVADIPSVQYRRLYYGEE